jgi:multidrug efflux system membrane fusion protein
MTMLDRNLSTLPDKAHQQTSHKKGSPTKKIYWRAIIQCVLSLIIVAAGLWGAQSLIEARKPVPVKAAEEQSYGVFIQEAQNTVHHVPMVAYGQMVARQKVELRALVSGEIVQVHPNLQEGAFLPKGTELLTIDPFQYEGALVEARSNLAEARARQIELDAQIASEAAGLERAREQVALAQRDLERAQRLVQSRAVSERQVDDRRLIVSQRQSAVEARDNALKIAKARLEQQKSTLERLQWRVRQAERDVQNTTLIAPFDAIIRSENVALGRLVNTNDVIVSLYNPSSLEARFNLSENQLQQWFEKPALMQDRSSQKVQNQLLGQNVRISAGHPSNVEWTGTIVRLGSDINRSAGGLAIFASVKAHEQTKQGETKRQMQNEASDPKPGAFVKVTLERMVSVPSVLLPETAVFESQSEQPYVFVVDEDKRLKRENVNILARQGQAYYVQGLDDGARVNITSFVEAGEGVLVEPFDQSQSLAPSS